MLCLWEACKEVELLGQELLDSEAYHTFPLYSLDRVFDSETNRRELQQ